MRTIVITPPEPIIDLEEAKVHLRVRHDDEDALIERYIAAATAHIDGPNGWLGRALGVQTLEARFDAMPRPRCMDLYYTPAINIVSVKYLDADRAEQTVYPAGYELIDRTVYPIANGAAPWSSAYVGRETIRVQYRAGYVANPAADTLVAAVPESIIAAILLMVGDMYAFRETASTGSAASAVAMSTTVEHLLAPFRVFA